MGRGRAGFVKRRAHLPHAQINGGVPAAKHLEKAAAKRCLRTCGDYPKRSNSIARNR